MLKKLVVFGLVGVLVVTAIKGTKFWGMARQQVTEAVEEIESKIPADKEIKRLRAELGKLDGDVEKLSRRLANEIVEVRHMTARVDQDKVALAQEKERLLAAGKALEGVKGDTRFVKFDGNNVPPADAKAILEQRVKSYQYREKELGYKERELAAREKTKAALEQQFAGFKAQKEQLSAAIAEVEAEVRILQLQQTESTVQTDNSRMARIKKSLADLNKKLEKDRIHLTQMNNLFGQNGTQPAAEKSVEEILAPLNGEASGEKVTTTK
jgi:chromosome segregation ATPase